MAKTESIETSHLRAEPQGKGSSGEAPGKCLTSPLSARDPLQSEDSPLEDQSGSGAYVPLPLPPELQLAVKEGIEIGLKVLSYLREHPGTQKQQPR